MRSYKVFIVLLLFFYSSNALFEDQVGKFDWRLQQLGCPRDVIFERTASDRNDLLVSTTRNVIGSVNTNSGEIVWRQLNEYTNGTSAPQIFAKKKELFSIVNGGEFLRVFDRRTGALKWQHRLNVRGLEKTDIILHAKLTFIRTQNTLLALNEEKTQVWRVSLASSIEWKGIAPGKNHVIAIGKDKTSGGLRIRFFAYENGKEDALQKDDAANENFQVNNCLISGNSLVCLDGRTLNTAYFTDDGFTRLSFVEIEGVEKLFDLRALDRPHLFTFRQDNKLSLLRVDEKTSEIVLSTGHGNVQTCTSDDRPIFAVYTETSKKLHVFDIELKKQIAEIEIPSENHAPISKIALLDAEQLFEIVVVREDCQVDFFEARRLDKTAASLEWSRFEGLASISSVEMIDLPLSDSQATIETEFGATDASILKSFFLRITGQFEQARRSFIALGNQFVRAFQLLTSNNESISNVLRVLWGEKTQPHKKPRTGSPLAESKFEISLERDYFNLNKLIVVSTLSGSVYGIHNQYGTVLWSLYLGTQFEPMKTQTNYNKVPLFIQRTTSHYQYNSQAAVTFRLKGTQKTRIIFFNPVNGQVVDSHTYDALKRVELAPFLNKEMLSPLILVDSSEKIRFLPALDSDLKLPYTVHLLSVDITTGNLKGQLVNERQDSLITAWTTKLNLRPDEKIVSIAGRNRNERVHSQGKVLGDRSVLYKYSNPNLVAILTVDPTHTVLTVYLVDSVSGSIVHMAKHDRASEPVNLLHCENWVVFSYWNEKSRRTEIGVIELFEGLEQTNVKHFNSFTTLQQPLNVVSNSFVFPQGISAIAASETEQGLTTRSVVIAMPFGGLLEVSKRFLDARRPIEMTADLREEMIIPYMPEIPIATEDLINYNQTVLQIDGIKTASSGLESTSLLLAYGLDLFYTRLTPSGTFDVLKDDFDYVLISVVLLALLVASVVLKKISRYQTLKQAWV